MLLIGTGLTYDELDGLKLEIAIRAIADLLTCNSPLSVTKHFDTIEAVLENHLKIIDGRDSTIWIICQVLLDESKTGLSPLCQKLTETFPTANLIYVLRNVDDGLLEAVTELVDELHPETERQYYDIVREGDIDWQIEAYRMILRHTVSRVVKETLQRSHLSGGILAEPFRPFASDQDQETIKRAFEDFVVRYWTYLDWISKHLVGQHYHIFEDLVSGRIRLSKRESIHLNSDYLP